MPDANDIRDHVIVDGSNIATEGRSLPSLAQLDEAVRSFLEEHPDVRITAVVDATFAHRIDSSEKAAYEQAVLDGDLVAPPAGAVGRGDAFVLAIAHKASATVLSNDSFQEFHGEYPWVFDEGRLIGGKPVDGVGWVFVVRSPVRGPISRRSQRSRGGGQGRMTKAQKAEAAKAVEAEVAARRSGSGSSVKGSKQAKKAESDSLAAEAAADMAEKEAQAQGGGGASGARSRGSAKAKGGGGSSKAKGDDGSAKGKGRGGDGSAKAKGDGGQSKGQGGDGGQSKGEGGRRRGSKAPETINEPGPFVAFVSEHPVGSTVEAVVDRFSSHGAYVVVDDAQCYVPLRSMADPPPRSAREVLSVGESRTFVVHAFDAPRRSIDLAVPDHEMADRSAIDPNPAEEAPQVAPAKKKAATKKKAAAKKAPAQKQAPAKKKAAAKKAPAKKKTTAKKAPAQKQAPAKKKAAAKKAPAKKAPVKKKASAKKAPVKKKASAKKAPAKKRA